MHAIGTVITLSALMLVAMLPLTSFIEPAAAFNDTTHDWIFDQAKTILENNAETIPKLQDYVDILDGMSPRDGWYWLERGEGEALNCAWDADGNIKTYEFEYRICPWDWCTLKWKIRSDRSLRAPWWLWQLNLLQLLLFGEYGYAAWFEQNVQCPWSYFNAVPPGVSSNVRCMGQVFEDYFNLAVSAVGGNWQTANEQARNDAMRWLGKASHFLHEAASPQKTHCNLASLILAAPTYTLWCNWVNKYKDDYKADNGIKWGYDLSQKWTPWKWINEVASFSSEYHSAVEVLPFAYDFAARRILKMIQRTQAELIAYFFDRVMKEEPEPEPVEVTVSTPSGVVSGQNVDINWNVKGDQNRATVEYRHPYVPEGDCGVYTGSCPDDDLKEQYWMTIDNIPDSSTSCVWENVREVDEPRCSQLRVTVRGWPNGDHDAHRLQTVVGYSREFTISPRKGKGPSAPSISVDVVSPVEGQEWMGNVICPIKWDAEADLGVDYVDIYYSATKGEETVYNVTTIGFPNTGVFIWPIPSELDGYDCTLYVRAYDSRGNWAEDSVDIIVRGVGWGYPYPEPPSVTVISPNGGEALMRLQDIEWVATGFNPLLFNVFLESETEQHLLAYAYADSSPTGEYSIRVDLSRFPFGDYRVRVNATEFIPSDITGIRSAEDTSDNYFWIGPTAHVFPSESTGQTFPIDLKASSVANLYSWEGEVTFDPTVLQCTDVEEGPFLASGGEVFWVKKDIDNTNGIIEFAATLIEEVPGVNGTGVLASATFNAIRLDNSSLSLTNIGFYDRLGARIAPTDIVDGYFTPTHDVMAKYVTVPCREVYPDWSIKTIISNVGNYDERVNVTAYLDDILIGAHATPIPPETDDELDFVIPFEPDIELYVNYTLRVEVSPVSGETILGDNLYIYGYVMIKMTGDITSDRKVDIRDITIAAMAFGTEPGHERWDPLADLNLDETVDIRDITIIAMKFGY